MTDSHESGTGQGHHVPTANEPATEDTSGVADMVEEGGPLEPVDVEEVEAAQAASAPAEGDEVGQLKAAVAELTNDLQRLQAEFLNYKRRVERDRDLVKENATYAALSPITEVIDTIDRAREHGPLEDGFRAVADQLERVVAGLGLTKFGAVGEPFDPTLHEALAHQGEEEGIEVPTIKVLVRSGFRIGDRVVRAAQVLVHGPVA
ncbi:MAG: nucleotide exchange factor GrpE [Nocardioides sp.]|uniref:nucleotide exchange factor GrpE n=1 Tax=Nocardioides sp. TaxID=35761 RepID=UPI003F0D34F4